MKIFNKKEGWSSKVNFVDDNNIVLGYDTDQACCEHADWFICDWPAEQLLPREQTAAGTPDEMPGWNFDPTFFKKVDYIKGGNNGYHYNDLDEGGMVIFRIVKDGEEKYIHLFNCHNGYYGHGFEFKSGDTAIKGGCI